MSKSCTECDLTQPNPIYQKFSQMLSKHKENRLLPHLRTVGNSKVPSSTAIFNMGSATHCPSKALGLCAAANCGVKCYALKAEYLYPAVLPFRERQEKYWLNVTAEEFALDFITYNMSKRKPHNALRLNESGDFHSQACVDKAERIATYLNMWGIVTYCYTSRSDLDYSSVKSLRISGSGFTKEGVSNIFQIVDREEDRPKGYGLCIGDCSKCDRCLRSGMKTAIVKH
jgi:hypothetical protein